MKRVYLSVIVLAMLVLSAMCSFGSTEEQRRLEYMKASLNQVTTLWAWMGDCDGNWSTNVSKPFVGGVAKVEMDLTYGPSLYWAGVNWQDATGYPLFSSYGSIKQIDSGMNYLDFAMYVNYWRPVLVNLSKLGVGDGEQVWINGSQAWFDNQNQTWSAYVPAPWNLTSLTVLWVGHGQWTLETDPTFNYAKPIILTLTGMDPTVTSPSQAFGVSYLGEISNPAEQVVFASEMQYDQSIGAPVLVCCNTLHKQYGEFKLMVVLQKYDPDLGGMVQYFSAYLTVQDGVILVPLVDGRGNSIGIQPQTWVKFIYEDPSDGGIWKQQWDSKFYSVSDGGGKD